MATNCKYFSAAFTLFFLAFYENAFKVEEDASESGKKDYINFKCIIWHKAFSELLATIKELSKIGYHIECADGIVHHIFPAILMLSADYEEQYVYYLCYGLS